MINKLKRKKKDAKKILILWAMVFIAFFIQIKFITGTPSPDKSTIHNLLVSGNKPTEVPVETKIELLSAQYEQEKLLLVKQVEEVKKERDQIKASRGEMDRKETLKKQKVVQAINNNLGGVLKNKGEYIYKTCKLYSVNPMLLTAIIKHETANGTSDLVKNANNVGGINWHKDCGYPKYGWYQKYPNVEVGIEKMARLIKVNYIDEGRGDIVSIGLKYAPPDDKRNGIGGMDNTKWAMHVTTKYMKILKEAES